MVAERLSVTDLAKSLVDVLERAHGGQQIAVEHQGEVIATIGPPSGDSGATLRELAITLTRLPPLDDEFEADIEAVRANQWPARIPDMSDILNRVKYKGERFVVRRNGEDIAVLQLLRDKSGITARELIAQVGNLKFPGDGFGDDLEAVQVSQPLAEMPEWPS